MKKRFCLVALVLCGLGTAGEVQNYVRGFSFQSHGRPCEVKVTPYQTYSVECEGDRNWCTASWKRLDDGREFGSFFVQSKTDGWWDWKTQGLALSLAASGPQIQAWVIDSCDWEAPAFASLRSLRDQYPATMQAARESGERLGRKLRAENPTVAGSPAREWCSESATAWAGSLYYWKREALPAYATAFVSCLHALSEAH